MARIRTIKPEFWTSAQVVECSLKARLLFIGLWNFCDDSGRIEDSPRQIKMKIFPGDDFTADDIHEMLNELSVNGLILRYQVEQKRFIQVTGWHHQKINRPNPSKFPEPPDTTHGALSEPHPPEGKGKEKEGSRGSPLTPLTGSVSDPGKTEPEAKTEPPAKAYRFQGKVIRLTQADFDKWAETYHAIPDLVAELQSIDDWCDANLKGEQRRKWFHRVSAMLGRKHQEATAKGGGTAPETDYSLYTRTGPPAGLEEQRAKVMGTWQPPGTPEPKPPPDPGMDPEWMEIPPDLDRRRQDKPERHDG